MTNKNLAKTVTGLALVGCLGVGATLAYLSDQSSLTNTFAISENGINITLDELVYGSENGERTEVGNNYTDLVPNQVVVKDPQVHVEPNSVNANVFVKVDNPNTNLTIKGLNTEAWQEVKKEGTATYYVYKLGAGAAEVGDTYSVVPTSKQRQDLEKVFEHVQVANLTSTANVTFQDIKVYAAAVQADSVTDVDAFNTAMDLFNTMAQQQ